MPKNAGEKLPTEAECMFVTFFLSKRAIAYVIENGLVSGIKEM
jgi:hypothetical protein